MKLENHKIYCSETLMPFEVKSVSVPLLFFKDQITNKIIGIYKLKEIIELPEYIFKFDVTKNFMNHTIIDENFNAYIMSNDADQTRYLKYNNTEYSSNTKFISKQNTVAFYKFPQVDNENYFVVVANRPESNISSKILKLSKIIRNYKIDF